VRALTSDGHQVICLSRSGETSAALAELGAEVLSGDLLDSDTVTGCVREAQPTHVAHLAAEIATQRNKDRIERINVHGTQTLVDACRDLELQGFLFLSTVVRGKAKGETFTEEDIIPATTAYGRSKAAGDAIVMHAHRDWGLPSVILRPSHVYGAGGWFAEIATSRAFRIPGKGENLWDVVHVDDVVSACMLLLQTSPPGEVYHVVDDAPITMNEFFGHVAQALDRKPYGHVPAWMAKIIKGSGPIVSAVRSARSTNDRLKALGWEPRYPRSADALPEVIREIRGTE